MVHGTLTLRKSAWELRLRGWSYRRIAKHNGVSHTAVRRWILRKIGTGDFVVEGRKRGMVVPAAQFRALLEILDNDRQAYLDEILDELRKPPHNFTWSKTTLQRLLKRLRITRKKVRERFICLT